MADGELNLQNMQNLIINTEFWFAAYRNRFATQTDCDGNEKLPKEAQTEPNCEFPILA